MKPDSVVGKVYWNPIELSAQSKINLLMIQVMCLLSSHYNKRKSRCSRKMPKSVQKMSLISVDVDDSKKSLFLNCLVASTQEYL